MGKAKNEPLTEGEKKVSLILDLFEKEIRSRYSDLFADNSKPQPKISRLPITNGLGTLILGLPNHFKNFDPAINWINRKKFSKTSWNKSRTNNTLSLTVKQPDLHRFSKELEQFFEKEGAEETSIVAISVIGSDAEKASVAKVAVSPEKEEESPFVDNLLWALKFVDDSKPDLSNFDKYYLDYFGALLASAVIVEMEKKSGRIKITLKGDLGENGLAILEAAKASPRDSGLSAIGWISVVKGPQPINPTFWFDAPKAIVETPKEETPEERKVSESEEEKTLSLAKQFAADNQPLLEADEASFFLQYTNRLTGVSTDFLSCFLSDDKCYIGVSIKKTAPNKVAAVALIELAVSNPEASGFDELSFHSFARPGGKPELWFTRSQVEEPVEEEAEVVEVGFAQMGQRLDEFVRALGYTKADKRPTRVIVEEAFTEGNESLTNEDAEFAAQAALQYLKRKGNFAEVLKAAGLAKEATVLVKKGEGYSKDTNVLIVSE